MDLMYGCNSDMDLSIQELFEHDMQNEINRMMSSDLGIDDLMGDTPLFQGLTEDGFDEYDLCFVSSAEASSSKGADFFDGGNKKGLGAVVNVPLKSQVSSSAAASSSRNSSNSTTTVTIIKGSNTPIQSSSTVTKNASSTVTIKQNGLGRPNVHRFGSTQPRTIVTTSTRPSSPPVHYVRVLSANESMPKNLSFEESYGMMVDPSSVIPASIGSTGSSSIGSETDPECLATDEEESESELMQGSVAAWIIPDSIASRTPSPVEPDFDEPQFITTQVGSHTIVEGPPTKKRKQKHHEPQPHTDGKIYPKPAFSYSCLIAMALKNSKTGSLPVSEIYKFMCDHFPYFKSAPSGWKNSVRHNLSLNKCFEKIEKPGNGARKGCLWALNPAKIHKMDEEVQKWSRKDPIAIRKAMSDPENLELIEKGELKRDYSGAGASDDDEDEDFSEPATPLTPAQAQARRSRTNSSDSTLEGTTTVVTPVVTTVSQVHAALQRSVDSKSQLHLKREDSVELGTITTNLQAP
ncbi:unnamed protein product [Orchesella dallaii]|uniref:Fork-head domain-containing protein n=1 Tax=Orchesella dallaii TaxID=48710 RepID=A0ABP1Q7T6_9HEXA